MSDRHLYKAKRKDNGERNGEWVEGYYFCMGHNDGRHVHHFIIPLGADLSKGRAIDDIQVEVDPSTICQCAGVKDRNGRLIWENDKVRRKIFGCEVSGIVKWTDIGFTGFRLEVSNKNGSKSFYAIGRGTYDDDMSERCDDEVIGNVFDNLELLEGGE